MRRRRKSSQKRSTMSCTQNSSRMSLGETSAEIAGEEAVAESAVTRYSEARTL